MDTAYEHGRRFDHVHDELQEVCFDKGIISGCPSECGSWTAEDDAEAEAMFAAGQLVGCAVASAIALVAHEEDIRLSRAHASSLRDAFVLQERWESEQASLALAAALQRQDADCMLSWHAWHLRATRLTPRLLQFYHMAPMHSVDIRCEALRLSDLRNTAFALEHRLPGRGGFPLKSGGVSS